jgi:hypothetical protein
VRLRRLSRTLLVLASSALTAACYETPRPECAFSCGPSAECPAGYTCRPDSWCKRADVEDTFACPNSPSDAAPPPDAAGPDAASPDAAPDASTKE